MVSNFGNLIALATPPWSLLAQIYVTVISDAIVRCIFGRRVWLSTKSVSLLVASLTFLSNISDAQKLFSCYLHRSHFDMHARYWNRIVLKEFKHFSKISYFLYTSLGSGVAADFFIAGSLCFSLSQRRTGFKKTDSLVTVLMMYTINTSLLTT
ncbi:hypothetical protein C0995_002355 [Termitomyces sp. Mi166|nr:hypothetical protein C0995_002355 [Termitomyces sp. Mi166\